MIDGLRFKDLDRNGKLDPYENWRLSPEARARDLLSRMTLDEKAGVMMHGSAPTVGSEIGVGDRYDVPAARKMIIDARVNAFITRLAGEPRIMAEENNKLQEIAETGRLGIPATISTDPRNAIRAQLGASVRAGAFSRWPEAIGLAAARDPALTRSYANTARREYLAVGIRQALSPQVDLVTEPRWPRIAGTFGEDAQLSKTLAQAYVEGMQNGAKGIGPDGVLAVVKHWVGYGAAKDGWDSHSYYGRYASYTGDNLAPHIIPFEGAFAAHVSGVMPTYSILQNATYNGKPIEQVGGGFNRFLITDLLRGKYKFDGVVMSDWLITSDCPVECTVGSKPGEKLVVGGMPWGVETLTQTERFAKAVTAGVDQFGGVVDSALLVDAVRKNMVTEARLDVSVLRILIQKFQQGLFESPYVDPVAAEQVVGSKILQDAGDEAQRRSLVLLRNEGNLLPLKPGQKVYLHNVDAAEAKAHGLLVVQRPEDADVSIVRVSAPFENTHPNNFFGSRRHEGRLSYRDGDEEYEAIKTASKAGRTVVVMYLDRPAVLANVQDKASAIVGNFGVTDGPLLDVLAGRFKPTGKLPFELPSSDEAVLQQKSDLPHDSIRPLYPYGFGLTYR
jgi:beta-glucosidase